MQSSNTNNGSQHQPELLSPQQIMSGEQRPEAPNMNSIFDVSYHSLGADSVILIEI